MIERHKALRQAFEYAESEYGVAEWPQGDNPRIVEYHAATDYAARTQTESWCASFVCWCLHKAGLASPQSPRARSFLYWGSDIDAEDPTIGDLVVLSRGSNPYNGHVGFYYPTTAQHWRNGNVFLLGGNQWNQVCVRSYDRKRIISIRSLWSADDPADIPPVKMPTESVIQTAEVSWEERRLG